MNTLENFILSTFTQNTYILIGMSSLASWPHCLTIDVGTMTETCLVTDFWSHATDTRPRRYRKPRENTTGRDGFKKTYHPFVDPGSDILFTDRKRQGRSKLALIRGFRGYWRGLCQEVHPGDHSIESLPQVPEHVRQICPTSHFKCEATTDKSEKA